MARAKGTNVIDVRAGARELQPAQAQEDEFLTLDESVSRFLTERAGGAADAVVKVYRAGGGPQITGRPGAPKMSIRDQYLYECPPDEFSEELLQEGYGEGIYRIRLYGTGGDGYGLLLNRKIEIGPRPNWKRQSERASDGLAGASINIAAPEGGDAIARALTTALQPILTAMAGMASQGNNRKAMLEEMQLMAQIVRGNQPAANPMEMFRAFSEFSREMNPGGDEGGMGVFSRLIDKFAPAFMEALQKGNAAAPTTPVLTAPVAQPAASAAAQPAGEDEAVLKLKMGLSFLVMQAEADNDPETYAGVVIDNVPPESLAGLAAMPDPIAHLATFEPKILQHREWFAELMGAVKEELAAGANGADPAKGDLQGKPS